MKRVSKEIEPAKYTVREGDTLAGIARKKTGSADWRAIYEQNRDLIGMNVNGITPGMILTIPGTAAAEFEEEDNYEASTDQAVRTSL